MRRHYGLAHTIYGVSQAFKTLPVVYCYEVIATLKQHVRRRRWARMSGLEGSMQRPFHDVNQEIARRTGIFCGGGRMEIACFLFAQRPCDLQAMMLARDSRAVRVRRERCRRRQETVQAAS